MRWWTPTRWNVSSQTWFTRCVGLSLSFMSYVFPDNCLLRHTPLSLTPHIHVFPTSSFATFRTSTMSQEFKLMWCDVQNLMKGYIARERGIIVLSKGGAFPGTGVWTLKPAPLHPGQQGRTIFPVFSPFAFGFLEQCPLCRHQKCPLIIHPPIQSDYYQSNDNVILVNLQLHQCTTHPDFSRPKKTRSVESPKHPSLLHLGEPNQSRQNPYKSIIHPTQAPYCLFQTSSVLASLRTPLPMQG